MVYSASTISYNVVISVSCKRVIISCFEASWGPNAICGQYRLHFVIVSIPSNFSHILVKCNPHSGCVCECGGGGGGRVGGGGNFLYMA